MCCKRQDLLGPVVYGSLIEVLATYSRRSSCLALLFPKLSRTSSSFSSCLLFIPSRVSTLAVDARLGERLHHDFVNSTNCIPRTASQVLRLGLFVRELVSHGDRDVDNFAYALHLRRAPGFLYSLDRGNLALYHHGDIPFCRLPELVRFPLSSERVLHCGNLVSVAQLGYPPLRRWTAFAAPTLSCGLSERGGLSLCHCVNVRQSQRLRRQHCLLNSLDREVLSSCDQLNFHHSIGELRLQRFHCFLNSLQHEVLSSCRRLLLVIFSFYCFQDRCLRSHLNDAKPTRDNAGSLPVT